MFCRWIFEPSFDSFDSLACTPPLHLQCRDGWYLLDGDCIESCPAQFASSGVGQFKRRCAEPFLCRSARLVVDPPVSYGCKCATQDNTAIAACQVCEHRAGEHGQHCLKCNGGKVGLPCAGSPNTFA